MENKQHRIYIRVSEAEEQKIKEKADARHLTVSAYIRMVLLSEKEDKK